MSMPSSSDEVATRPRRVPIFRRSSISLRCATATLPWCARTSVSPASSLIAPGDALGQAAAVDEDERGAMRASPAPAAWDGWRSRWRAAPGPAPQCRWAAASISVEARHVLDRHFDLQRKPLLGSPRVHNGDGAVRRGNDAGVILGESVAGHNRACADGFRHAAEKARHLVQRALRGGEPNALQRVSAEMLQPLQLQRQVRAALAGHQGVDLVEDEGFHRGAARCAPARSAAGRETPAW